MNFLKIVAPIMLLFSLFGLCSAEASTQSRPNILWLVAEDPSAHWFGPYDSPQATTPNIDQLANRGVVYEHAFTTSPVCAPARFAIITGMYANAMGTENMRSHYPVPDFVRFFPEYLRQAGYYTVNNHKKDYNTVDQPQAWNESSSTATYQDRKPGQPFFYMKNIFLTHESYIQHPEKWSPLIHNPEKVTVPPYLPSTSPVKRSIAHYEDQITKEDAVVGKILDGLKQSGLAKNTIVFFFSDHGGVLPRSKRFMYNNGLHIPMIVYFPSKYADLAPKHKHPERLVSSVDLGPTVLSLAGIKPPASMQGKAFLGKYAAPPRNYVHMFRKRMDERYDLIRDVRDKQFLYIHNYMPRRIYGQHISYLWRAPAMQSWFEQYLKGNLDQIQQRFWQTKPTEELYQVAKDPYNIHNLASDPAFQDVLHRMRRANRKWMLSLPDLGFIPESRFDAIRGGKPLYTAVRKKHIPVDKIIETAEMASRARQGDLRTLATRLNDPNVSVQYWAAKGLAIAGKRAEKYRKQLLRHAKNSSPEVRMEVAAALYHLGDHGKAFRTIRSILGNPGVYVNLEALNVLQAMNPMNLHLPPKLREKVQKLKKQSVGGHDDEGKSLVHLATESLLKEPLK
jgi:arylsulfatase A-like enzyme